MTLLLATHPVLGISLSRIEDHAPINRECDVGHYSDEWLSFLSKGEL
jgi:hypothetical protein